jgi:hypothetical protein
MAKPREYMGTTTLSGKRLNLHMPKLAVDRLRLKERDKFHVYLEGSRLIFERPG